MLVNNVLIIHIAPRISLKLIWSFKTTPAPFEINFIVSKIYASFLMTQFSRTYFVAVWDTQYLVNDIFLIQLKNLRQKTRSHKKNDLNQTCHQQHVEYLLTYVRILNHISLHKESHTIPQTNFLQFNNFCNWLLQFCVHEHKLIHTLFINSVIESICLV